MWRKIPRKIEAYFTYFVISFKWIILGKYTNGICNDKYDAELIVSLTTYPKRVKYVSKAIRSLLMQSMKPNRIILWLSDSEFPKREEQLPKKLLALKENGLEIRWCDQLYSFKKLVPTIKNFPNANIVTADDDLIYRHTWLADLYEAHLDHPNLICAHRVTKIIYENGYKTVVGGYDCWRFPCYLNKLTSGAGVLFPPGSLYKDVCDDKIFLDICKTNDDIWFWDMGILQGIKVCPVLKKKHLNLIIIRSAQKCGSLSKINDFGEKRFWKDFNSMTTYYDQIDRILREEQKRILNKELGDLI